MANEQNLKRLSPREAREQGRKGGKKSVEVRAERKKMRELLEIALAMPDDETGEQNAVAVTAALISKAKAGDTKAYEVIRDTVGEKPVEKVLNDVTLTQALVVFDETPEKEKLN